MTAQLIEKYKKQVDEQKSGYLELQTDADFRELFRGVVVMFLTDIVSMYNRLISKMPQLKLSQSAEKISNINLVLESLEANKKLFGFDCNDLILRGYINYFYTKYRDIMMEWDLDKIKTINESNIKGAVMSVASEEKLLDKAMEHLNIIPEVVMIVNNLKDREILKILYLLNNLNTIIDVYLYKKESLK